MRRRDAASLALALAVYLLVALCACTQPQTLPWSSRPSASYAKELRNWTRKDEIFESLMSQAKVTVTCFSPSFASALQRERSNRSLHDEVLTKQLITEAKRRSNESLTFFVSLHTQNHFWNDLDTKNPTFKMKLYSEDKTGAAPIRIQRLNQNQMADWATLFPYLTLLDTGYLVEFDAIPQSQALRLIISGNPGALELTWQISH